jgi:hypothetical protein
MNAPFFNTAYAIRATTASSQLHTHAGERRAATLEAARGWVRAWAEGRRATSGGRKRRSVSFGSRNRAFGVSQLDPAHGLSAVGARETRAYKYTHSPREFTYLRHSQKPPRHRN